MADITKYAPINGGTLISDFKAHFSTKRRTVAFAYAVVFVFIAFTIFLAFSPSANIFAVSGTESNSPSSSSGFSDEAYRSQFSSIYSYFFPNSSSLPSSSQAQNNSFPGSSSQDDDSTKKAEMSNPINSTILPSVNQTVNNNTSPQKNSSDISKRSPDIKNQPQNNQQLDDKNEALKRNQTHNNQQLDDKNAVLKQNQTQKEELHDGNGVSKANQSTIGDRNGISEKGAVKNLTSSLMKKGTVDDLMKSLMNCDMFDGNWVKDESYPLYKPGSCSLIDEQFNCFLNGRPDNGYLKLKWKPKGCTLPRLNGGHMLELLRGKRLVFVGDSLNRNMWESLICILRNSVKDQKKVYEESGRVHFRSEAAYSFVFEDYKCTVEFFVAPFLVQEWEVDGKNGTKKETLRLDLISRAADKYKDADFIVFNTGHWWTHEKTSTGKDYYQEGSHVYSELDVLEAFRKAITTWGRWVDANVNPTKSLVFFRGYSASHFSGGQWNSGGACDNETEPIKNETYLTPYPPKMTVLEKVFKGMKTPVNYLNVTRITDYRKDGHPSIYRKQHLSDEERRSPLLYQDCSHWCLPGVPDAWNEILYAQILVRLHEKQQQQQKRP